MEDLSVRHVFLNRNFATKRAAIEATGQALVDLGYVTPAYIPSMHARDELTSTYIGNQVAIPHGSEGSEAYIKKSGIVIFQVPNGVDFAGQQAKLLIGIAGAEGQHLELLSQIAIVCSDETNVEKITTSIDEETIIEIFKGVN